MSNAVVKLPYPPLLLRVLLSSAFVWLLVRLTYAIVMIFGLPPDLGVQSALHPTFPSRLLLAVLTAVLVHLDRKLAHEHLLQANFGVPAVWFSATSLVAAGVLDIAVQALILAI